MPRQVSPANAWCFTLNNWTESEYEFLSSKLLSLSDKYFYIVGKEVGETGTPHLQGYIALKDEKKKFRPLPTFAVARGEGQAVHFERAKGSGRQNYMYCSKDGDFITNMPKPTMTVEEAKALLEQPPIIVDNDDECYVVNAKQREEAALRIAMQDWDIMTDECRKMIKPDLDAA